MKIIPNRLASEENVVLSIKIDTDQLDRESTQVDGIVVETSTSRMAPSVKDIRRIEYGDETPGDSVPSWSKSAVESMILRGAELARTGRRDEALACYVDALKVDSDNVEALNDLANLFASEGKIDSAISCYQRALAVNPDFHHARYNLGVVYARLNRLDDAAKCFEDIAARDPYFGVAFKYLGIIRSIQNRLEEAASSFERAASLIPNDADLFNEWGIVLSRGGRFANAIDAYNRALVSRPNFPDAINNMGNALRGLGKIDDSIKRYQEAIKLRPSYAEAFNNLGIALRQKGNIDDAIKQYQEALRIKPDYPEAFHNLGLSLAARGKFEAALICFQQAVRIKPNYADAYFHWGNVLGDRGMNSEAVERFREALKLRPDDPRLYKSLATALAKMEKFDEAIEQFQRAIKLRPQFAEAYNDLGITYARYNRFEEAIKSYEQAIRVRPEYAEAHNNLGNALRNLGKFDESIQYYQRAIRFKPHYADAHNNLGIAYAEMARFDEAVASYTECIKIKPDHVDAHMNRSLTWLRMGEYDLGWAEYEWRWKKRSLTNRPLLSPLWNGFPLKGRTILLITEQGFGDTFQFIRHASILKDQGARVILECPDRLIKVLERTPGVDRLIALGAPRPEHDVHAPLMTVAGLLKSTNEYAPETVPYIHADPRLVEKWRAELATDKAFKVGINWQGNPKYAGDHHRSIPLKHFEPLSRVDGVRLYSVQKNHGVEQIDQVRDKFEIVDLGKSLDGETGPFMDTAAVLKNLDLFITSDTAVAHLAGALGVPVWLILSSTPDWRWLSDREDCPWYPSMRLFRQLEHRQWHPVFARMAEELRKVVETTRRLRGETVLVEISPGELIDKITILEIKRERFNDSEKRTNVCYELNRLVEARNNLPVEHPDLSELTNRLREVNETLWRIEDDIRDCERRGDFGPLFIDLARSVYHNNDERASIKRRINQVLGSKLIEEKSYVAVS